MSANCTHHIASDCQLQVPRRLLRLLHIRQRFDDMTMFCVVAAALLMSMALLPAYGATSPQDTKEAGAKSERLRSNPVIRACSDQPCGNESAECLVAIVKESGRDDVRFIRSGCRRRNAP